MLKERAEAYYKRNYNCAETIIRAANDEYQLGLSEEAMKLTGGFGGGMGCGKTCGALCGGICALSGQLIETKAHETPELRKKSQKLVRAFQDILGGLDCRELAPKYKTPQTGCLQTILLGCEALEQAMGE